MTAENAPKTTPTTKPRNASPLARNARRRNEHTKNVPTNPGKDDPIVLKIIAAIILAYCVIQLFPMILVGTFLLLKDITP